MKTPRLDQCEIRGTRRACPAVRQADRQRQWPRESFRSRLGSDTGGSVRQPASLCGVLGLKPTYGRNSRYGLVAFASSLDQVGIFARKVEDVARVLGVIAGRDPHDATTADVPVPDYTASLTGDIKGARVGFPRALFGEGLDEEVGNAVKAVVDVYRDLGAEIVDVDLPHAKYAIAVYYIIATAEASSNLARFDGVRYGFRAEDAPELRQMYRSTREEGFGPKLNAASCSARTCFQPVTTTPTIARHKKCER